MKKTKLLRYGFGLVQKDGAEADILNWNEVNEFIEKHESDGWEVIQVFPTTASKQIGNESSGFPFVAAPATDALIFVVQRDE